MSVKLYGSSMVGLKKITEDDLEWARKLRNDNRHRFFYDGKISKQSQQQWFRDLNYDFYVAWDGEVRIGTISLCKGEIGNVLIDHHYRGKGYGREMMLLVVKMALELGFMPRVEVFPGMVSYYECFGFKPIKVVMEMT